MLLNTLETAAEFQNYITLIVKTAAVLAYKEMKLMPLGDLHMQIKATMTWLNFISYVMELYVTIRRYVMT